MSAGDVDKQRADLLAFALSTFPRFAGLLEILPKSGPKCRLVLNEIQRRYSAERTHRDTVLKPRQIGFTTMEQARDVYHFLTVPGARVVITCQSTVDHQPQKLLSANYQLMFDSLKRAGLKLDFRSETNTRWILAGQRDSTLTIIEAGASEASARKKGRAGTVTRLHLTETAFYDYADDTLNALLESVPSVEKGSEIVSESTPNGATGFFYRQCKAAEAGSNGYKLHFYPWYEALEYAVPLDPGERIEPQNDREELLVEKGVKPEQLKWYRRKIADKGQDQVDQEYPSDPETCFLTSGRAFFDQAVNKALIERAPNPIEKLSNDRVWIWKRPEPGRGYVIGADTSEGTGGDDSAAPVLDWETGEHVATLLCNLEPFDYAAELARLGYFYNTALIAVERNNHGHSVLQALVHPPPDSNGQPQQSYPCLYMAADEKLGWLTSSVTRPVMLDDVAEAHRKGFWSSPDRRVLQQFKTFVVGSNGKPEAATGEKDDLVMGSAIAWEIRQRSGWVPPPPEQNIQPYQRQW
jgi:hypothetical protein